MKKIVVILFALVFILPFKGKYEDLCAQVMVNNGGLVFMTNDVIFVNGGVTNQADGSGSPGTFTNSGQLYVTGDWNNSAGNTAFTNAAMSNSNSDITVYLNGGNQNVTGTSVTEFHNLRLRGSGIKQLNGIDAIVQDTLDVNSFELATGVNKLFVNNVDPDAIEYNSAVGFVSSLDGGYLARNTSSANRYMFPVGSSVGQFRYRPVEIAPDNIFLNTYAVRMANVDATTEGYDVSLYQSSITRVNDNYYHQITRESGQSPASITVYYNPALDGDISGLGHWQTVPQWEDIVSNPDASNYGLSATTRTSWDFSATSPAFALIKILNECGEMFVPSAFSPDGNGENDMECVYGKCVEDVYFVIYDRWGEKVFETNDISKCWDGRYRGKEMNTAVFVYYMKAKLTTGDEVVKKGNITLVK